MQNSAKPAPTPQLSELMDTIRTQLTDDPTSKVGGGAGGEQHSADTSTTEPSRQPQPQKAPLQTVIGGLDDGQLLVALSQVSDYRLAGILERRLRPAEPQASQPRPVAPSQDDNRSQDRAKILRSGKIIYNNKMSVSDCTIRDISATGCRIAAESTAGIPSHFTLHILNGDVRHECEVAWRSSVAMGVKFIG